MKKKNICVLALTALLSFGTIASLTACGPTTSSDDYGDVECDSISINRKAVYEIEVGETIDLADYVKVNPENCKWKLEAVTSNVKVSGTKVTGTAAGAFKVRIVAGASETPKNYTGTVISHELANIKKAAAKIEDNNFTSIVSDEKNGIAMGVWRTNNYFAYVTSNEEETESIVEGLFTSGNGHTCAFTIDGEWDIDKTTYLPTGGNFTVDSKYYASLDLYSFGEAIALEGDEFEDDLATGEVIISKEKFDTLLPMVAGVDSESIENAYTKTISDIFVTYEEGKLVFTVASGKNDICTIEVGNFGTTAIAPVDAYITAKTEPEQIQFTEFNSFFADLLEKKNYTLTGAMEMGYFDSKDVWHTTSDKSILSEIKSDWGLEPVSITAKADQETYLAYEAATKDTLCYTLEEGNETLSFFSSIYDSEKDEYTYSGDSSSLESIWTNRLATSETYNGKKYTAPAAITPSDFDEELLGLINWGEVTTSGSKKTAVATPYGDAGYTMALNMALIPMYGNSLSLMMSTLSSSAYPTAKWYDFFEQQTVTVDTAAKTVELSTALVGMASDKSGTYYGARFVVTIGEVGTTDPAPLAQFVEDAKKAIEDESNTPESTEETSSESTGA